MALTMTVERLLQINIAALTTLGTLLLGMGEHDAILPVLAVIVASSSVYLTDARGWLQLNTLAANIAGLIALAVTVHHWHGYAAESQLLALANLLIYLQFVLHYRKKNIRSYWLLVLLSLLQVAVASALNLNIAFGALLPAYLIVGLATMALFVLYREQSKYAEPSLAGALAVATPLAASASDASQPATARRWPLAGRPAAFSGVQPAGSIETGLNWGFTRQIAWIAVATMILALMWFIGLPRLGKKSPWQPRGAAAFATIGFTENVALGELGEVSENPEEVMQVRFVDFAGGEGGAPYRIAGDGALFRGGALERYHRGEWQRRRSGNDPVKNMDRFNPADVPREAQLVKEIIRLRPRSDAVVFSVMPAFQAGQFGLSCSAETAQISRQQQSMDEPGTYELITTNFRDHVPVRAIPAAK
ncbi:MAG TPA: transglutaminaseTgpA domain-containing protein, partial [Pirellulales bacterium]|nr:transglutaminaseTgpA domain-containing protein [Pirellulales bacterium]